jgi:hypothetical protein
MRKKNKKKVLYYLGSDQGLNSIHNYDQVFSMSVEKKFELICELGIFQYQLKNGTDAIPRFLRTTANIRKA